MPWSWTSLRHQRKRNQESLSRGKVISMPVPAQLRSRYNTISSSTVLEHTVQMTPLNKRLCSKRPTHMPVLLNIITNYSNSKHRKMMTKPYIFKGVIAWSEPSLFTFQNVGGIVRVCRLRSKQLLVHIQKIIHSPILVIIFFGGHSHGCLQKLLQQNRS